MLTAETKSGMTRASNSDATVDGPQQPKGIYNVTIWL